ncbi:kinase-like domain-containing protein, partial [Suillus bovinus]|uniref:kinase-like domain-containing protein n=1 Tax=Suillus bovinus TaxID=48563 RepID=UPI001B8777E4
METTFGPYQEGLANGKRWRHLLISLSIIALQVAVKSFRHHIDRSSEQDLRRFRRETAIWAHLVHDNIVKLYGTTEEFGPTTALVSQWFPDGTLSHLITEKGATLTIKSKFELLHGIASGLYYLHSFPVVHGDITSISRKENTKLA